MLTAPTPTPSASPCRSKYCGMWKGSPAAAVVHQDNRRQNQDQGRRSNGLSERPRLRHLAFGPLGRLGLRRCVVAVREQAHLLRGASQDQRIGDHQEHEHADSEEHPYPSPRQPGADHEQRRGPHGERSHGMRRACEADRPSTHPPEPVHDHHTRDDAGDEVLRDATGQGIADVEEPNVGGGRDDEEGACHDEGSRAHQEPWAISVGKESNERRGYPREDAAGGHRSSDCGRAPARGVVDGVDEQADERLARGPGEQSRQQYHGQDVPAVEEAGFGFGGRRQREKNSRDARRVRRLEWLGQRRPELGVGVDGGAFALGEEGGVGCLG